jgi:hypothetical protein
VEGIWIKWYWYFGVGEKCGELGKEEELWESFLPSGPLPKMGGPIRC